jgi:hypothetical protein
VASQESLLGPPNICGGVLPLRIVPLDQLVDSPAHLHSLLNLYGRQKYLLECRVPEGASSSGKSGGIGSSSGACGSGNGTDGQQQAGISSGSEQQRRGWWPPRLGLPWRRSWRQEARITVCLMDDVAPQDVLEAVLEAAHLRRALRKPAGRQQGYCCSGGGGGGQGCPCPCGGGSGDGSADAVARLPPQQLHQARVESRRFAQRNAQAFMRKVADAGWQTRRILLNTAEKQGFTRVCA